MVQLIETVIENEKSRGETSKISNPLPREKIRPIETGRARIAKVYILRDNRASFWYAMGVLIIVGSIIGIIIVGSIIIGIIADSTSTKDIDRPLSERAHVSESYKVGEDMNFVRSDMATSSPDFH